MKKNGRGLESTHAPVPTLLCRGASGRDRGRGFNRRTHQCLLCSAGEHLREIGEGASIDARISAYFALPGNIWEGASIDARTSVDPALPGNICESPKCCREAHSRAVEVGSLQCKRSSIGAGSRQPHACGRAPAAVPTRAARRLDSSPARSGSSRERAREA